MQIQSQSEKNALSERAFKKSKSFRIYSQHESWHYFGSNTLELACTKHNM